MDGGFTLRCVRIADGTTLFEHLLGPLGAPMFLAMTLDGTRVLCGLSTGVALVLPHAALTELAPGARPAQGGQSTTSAG